jgi:hypothetical protein
MIAWSMVHGFSGQISKSMFPSKQDGPAINENREHWNSKIHYPGAGK